MNDAQTPPEPEWSEAIVMVARLRDKERFAALFVHFAPRLKAFFVRTGVPAMVAEEIAQEALLTVWRKASYFDPERASAATWIFSIARNLRIDLKRRERDPNLLVDFYDFTPVPTPGDEMLTAERDDQVRAAITQLPPEQLDVIRLSFFEGRPHGEIAGALNIPLGTVKSRVRLAMQRLRVLMGAGE